MRVANVEDWRSDPELCKSGAPLDLGKGRTLYVRRFGQRNREFMVAAAGMDSKDEAAQMRLYARTLVAGWSGFNDKDGNAVPFSVEECFELFRAAPEIFDAVHAFSVARANFRVAQVEEDRAQVKTLSTGAKVQALTANS